MGLIPYDFSFEDALDFAPPIGALYRTGKDIVHGDVGNIPGDITGYNSVKNDISMARDATGKLLKKPDAGPAGPTPGQIAAQGLVTSLGNERANAPNNRIENGITVSGIPNTTPRTVIPTAPRTSMGAPNPHPLGGTPFVGTPGGGQTDPHVNWINTLRQQQLTNLQTLRDAAAGKVPSAAEIQGRNMADRAAAQQFGAAAALAGGRAPGSVMRRGLLGSADVAAQARQDSAALRAQEQANARGQLTTALTGARGAENELGITQATLDQRERASLLDAQLRALGIATNAGESDADRAAREKAATDAYNAQLWGLGGTIAGGLIGGPAGAAIGGGVGKAVGQSGAGDTLMSPTYF